MKTSQRVVVGDLESRDKVMGGGIFELYMDGMLFVTDRRLCMSFNLTPQEMLDLAQMLRQEAGYQLEGGRP